MTRTILILTIAALLPSCGTLSVRVDPNGDVVTEWRVSYPSEP